MSDCKSCGCEKKTVACAKCEPEAFAMIPVEKRNSATGLDCGPDDECPPMEEFYSETNQLFYTPPTGGNSQLFVCDPSRYTVGQWVHVQGAGLYSIEAVGEKSLTVRGSCDNGEEEEPITGNAVPGTGFSIGTRFWLVSEPAWPYCVNTEEFCAMVVECLRNETDLCLTSIPDANNEDEYHLFGGTGVACDQENEDSLVQSCLRKITNIFAKGGGLCYPNRSATNGNKESCDGNNQSKRFVVNLPGGCDKQLALPDDDNANGFYKYCDGNIVFVEDAKFYIYKNEVLFDEEVNLTVGTQSIGPLNLPDLPSSDCGVIALIHAEVFAYTGVSADYFSFNLTIEGDQILIFSANEQFNANGVPFPGHNDNTIPIEITNGTITGQLLTINPTVNGVADIKIWLRGYYV